MLTLILFFEHDLSAFIFLGLIGIYKWFSKCSWLIYLGRNLWSKFIGSIKALTTALMVFSTAFGTALFGLY